MMMRCDVKGMIVDERSKIPSNTGLVLLESRSL